MTEDRTKGTIRFDWMALAKRAVQIEVVLQQIADPSFVGNYSDTEVVAIYREWARNVLEADRAD